MLNINEMFTDSEAVRKESEIPIRRTEQRPTRHTSERTRQKEIVTILPLRDRCLGSKCYSIFLSSLNIFTLALNLVQFNYLKRIFCLYTLVYFRTVY